MTWKPTYIVMFLGVAAVAWATWGLTRPMRFLAWLTEPHDVLNFDAEDLQLASDELTTR